MEYQRRLIAERGLRVEAQVLEVIRALSKKAVGPGIPIKEVAKEFRNEAGDVERHITPKWIGAIVRAKLGLATYKSHGVFVIPFSESRKLERLYEKYGITEDNDACKDGIGRRT